MSTSADNKGHNKPYTYDDASHTYTLYLSRWANSYGLSILMWFTIIAIGAFIFTKAVYSESAGENIQVRMAQTLDITIFTLLIIYFFFVYYSSTNAEKERLLTHKLDELQKFVDDPFSIVSVAVFMAGLYLVIYAMGIPMGENKSKAVWVIENIAIILVTLLLIHTFFNIILGLNLYEMIRTNTFTLPPRHPATTTQPATSVAAQATQHATTAASQPAAAAAAAQPTQATQPAAAQASNKNEVYNVSHNIYTYEEAPAVCLSLNGTLATYDQVEDAYKNGGEWCNYGWTEGNMALFPTQKRTWENADPETREQCGRPGINGGIVKDATARFGVNCYGVKPPGNEGCGPASANDAQKYDSLLDEKIKLWRQNARDFFELNPFNNDNWSKYH